MGANKSCVSIDLITDSMEASISSNRYKSRDNPVDFHEKIVNK